MLAAVGRPQVSTHRKPRVAVFSTGDELVDLDIEPGPGQIRIKVEAADLPDIGDLVAEKPPLSPTILGLFRGLPLDYAERPTAPNPNPAGRAGKGRPASAGPPTSPSVSEMWICTGMPSLSDSSAIHSSDGGETV